MQKKLSDEHFKSYMKCQEDTGHICCPLCKSTDITSHGQVYQGFGCANIFDCRSCGAAWDEVYETVISVIIKKENKTMSLSKESREEYLKNKGNKCPFCKSTNLEANRPYLDDFDESFNCRIHCLSCGNNWLDTYTLTNITADEDEE